jgi:hypothetical protein
MSSKLYRGCLFWRGCTRNDANRRGNVVSQAGIPKDKDLKRKEALMWILRSQPGRRNLVLNQKTLYIGQLYNTRKRNVGAQTRKSKRGEK